MSDLKFNCPHCKQSLEAPEDMLGQTIECPSCQGAIQIPSPQPELKSAPKPQQLTAARQRPVASQTTAAADTRPCPYCGENILRSAQKCKHCGEFLKGAHEVRTNVKQGALIGAVACFVIGLILMFVSLWSFIIYSPLFLAAFILSIVAMSQKRVAGGLVTLLLTLIVPPILFFGLGAVRGKKAVDEVSKALDQASAHAEKTIDVPAPTVSVPSPVAAEEPAKLVPTVLLGSSVVIDEVQIAVRGVRIDHIERKSLFGDSTRRSDQKYLLLDLTLQNTSPGRIVYLQQIWEHTKLIDEFDNIEGCKFSDGFSTDSIVGYIGSTKLKPGESQNDMMIFDLPVDAAQSFRIESDPRIWKSMGEDRVKELSDDSFTITFTRGQIGVR
jgi:uncharacterized protein (DUF983 family)